MLRQGSERVLSSLKVFAPYTKDVVEVITIIVPTPYSERHVLCIVLRKQTRQTPCRFHVLASFPFPEATIRDG
jgi:hypothetical protein